MTYSQLSGSEPNLQNIPIRTLGGRRMRESFMKLKDRVFVEVDYSQVELRILATLLVTPIEV